MANALGGGDLAGARRSITPTRGRRAGQHPGPRAEAGTPHALERRAPSRGCASRSGGLGAPGLAVPPPQLWDTWAPAAPAPGLSCCGRRDGTPGPPHTPGARWLPRASPASSCHRGPAWEGKGPGQGAKAEPGPGGARSRARRQLLARCTGTPGGSLQDEEPPGPRAPFTTAPLPSSPRPSRWSPKRPCLPECPESAPRGGFFHRDGPPKPHQTPGPLPTHGAQTHARLHRARSHTHQGPHQR